MNRSARFGVAVLALALLAAGAWFALGVADPLGLRGDATWLQMQQTRDFRVGLDPSFPPFESLDAAGVPVGYDVDLARALAERWDIVAKVETIGFDSLIDALRASRIDAVISAMPYDERLTRDVTFSPAYFEAGIRLAVRPGSQVQNVDDLAGKRVAVEWGSAGDSVARRLQEEDGISFEITQHDTPEEAMNAAAEDPSVDAVLVDQVSLRLAQGQGMELVAVGPVLESNPYVIVTPRRAGTLAAELAAALEAFAADGTLAAIEDRWFGPRQQAEAATGD